MLRSLPIHDFQLLIEPFIAWCVGLFFGPVRHAPTFNTREELRERPLIYVAGAESDCGSSGIDGVEVETAGAIAVSF